MPLRGSELRVEARACVPGAREGRAHLRREDLLLQALRAEESRREKMRRAIVEHFDVSGDPRFVVRRRDVHEAVRIALGEDTLPPAGCAAVTLLVRQLGGAKLTVSNRRFFRGVRHKAQPIEMALLESKHLRQRTVGDGKHGKHGKYVRLEPTPQLTKETWEARLATEGMPSEVGRAAPVDKVREKINVAALAKAAVAQRVLELWREGLSLRKVEAETGVDQSTVHRMLVRMGVSTARRSITGFGDAKVRRPRRK